MNQPEDVEVILGYGRHYKFHSGTLARNSPLFADMLTEPNAAQLSSRARNAGIKIRWMIELVQLPCDKYPAGRFDLVKLNKLGERADNCEGLIVNENGLIPQAKKCFKQYESILYAFYNKDLVIKGTNMVTALEHCDDLLEKSDYLGCTNVISKPIEVALLKYGQEVFQAIANAPHAWVKLAVRIRSELLFQECLVHLVGNWRALEKKPHLDVRKQLSEIPGLVALIERHHKQLLERCQKLELSIVSLIPSTILPSQYATRADLAKHILGWAALTFYREWFTQCLVKNQGQHAADCGYALYKELGAGADADADRELLKEFQETKFTTSSKAVRVMEHHLMDIKNCVKEVVEEYGILTSKCQLNVEKFPVSYLTCVVFDKREYPWESHMQGGALGKRKKYLPGGNDIAMLNLNSARKSKGISGVDMREGEEGDEGDDEFESDDMESGSERGKRTKMT
ncbi:hypothetical protein yc1106_02328 [Curvularia clavata]|uniref:BTB domain-containing protein n=1 Tax=Curvularia clavata TaxID=95742 RepID=A0A9Q9DQU3_CURCL|nr:hypothetical protein yc1106_02328 [Curvularia clavata]